MYSRELTNLFLTNKSKFAGFVVAFFPFFLVNNFLELLTYPINTLTTIEMIFFFNILFH